MYTLIVNGRPSESQRSATTRIQLFGDTEASKVICTRKERLPSVSTAIDGISFNLRKSCCIGKCILKLKSVNFAVTSIWPPKIRRWKCKRGVIKRRPRGHALVLCKRVVSRKHHQCHALYRMGRHNGALQVSSFSPSLLSIFVQSFQRCCSNHLDLLIPTDDLLRL